VTIFTIGHSTHPLSEFARLLEAHEIRQLGDIRTVPRSRRHPHFSREALAVSLPDRGIAYRHFPSLGGRRKPRPDSRTGAWRVEGFRGYADYMETPEFEQALDELLAWAAGPGSGSASYRSVIMCAESVWWRCHRQLVADALVARGVEVRHITSEKSPTTHILTAFARLTNQRVSYPGLDSLTG
jgi:uncharacterized protein (DUF488 family)